MRPLAPLEFCKVRGSAADCFGFLGSQGDRSQGFGKLVKGRNSLLVLGGEIQWKAMRKTHVTTHDLEEALRREGEEPDVSRIREANLERNGEISLIMRE